MTRGKQIAFAIEIELAKNSLAKWAEKEGISSEEYEIFIMGGINAIDRWVKKGQVDE